MLPSAFTGRDNNFIYINTVDQKKKQKCIFLLRKVTMIIIIIIIIIIVTHSDLNK